MKMLHRVKAALLGLLCLVSLTAQAVDFSHQKYDLYFGDVNNDGISDIYLDARDIFILIHGDVSVPLLLPPVETDLILTGYFDSGEKKYNAPVVGNLTDTQLLSLTKGSSASLHYTDLNGDGKLDLIIITNDIIYTEVHISGGSTSTLPTVLAITNVPTPLNPSSNLPTLDTTDQVGSVGGSFRVDESGAATYNVPIATVKGTAGVVPQISLNYSSQAGNGLMGKGWSIGGLSAITRCRQTLSQDTQAKAITWSANDRFCLDGQRLILETTGADYGDVGATYKTEIDNFARITSKDGINGHPDYFEVERKDGSVSRYGNSGISDAEQVARTSNGDATNNTLTWALDRFEDSAENPIEFDYEELDSNDSSIQGHRISRIKYAYGSSSSHNAHIDFLYDNRDDDISGYVAGYEFSSTQRLTTIKSYNDNVAVRQYNLDYADVSNSDNKLSRLESIQECRDTDCLSRTYFTWSMSQIGFGNRVYSQTNAISTEIPLIGKPGDFNGDGKMDMVFAVADVQDSDVDYELRHSLSNGTRLVPQTSLSIVLPDEDHGKTFAWHVIDYNNDGYSDVIRGGGSGNWKVHLSNGTKLTNTAIDTGVPTSSQYDASFLDLNSDGLPDFIRDKGNNTYGLRFMEQVSQGGSLVTRFSSQETDLNLIHTEALSGSNVAVYVFKGFGTNPITGDFNGDGNVDFIGELEYYEGSGNFADCVQGIIYPTLPPQACVILFGGLANHTVDNLGIYLSDGQGGYTFDSRLANRELEDIRVVDVNADGLTDYLLRNGSNQWKLYLNRGTSFAMTHNVSTIPNHKMLQFLDYNQDGYQDLIYPSGTYYRARVFNPETQSFDSAQGINITYGGNTTNETLYFMDINGDNSADMVRYYVPGAWGNNKGNADAYVRLSNVTNEDNAVVNHIFNGLGAETVIDYSPLNDNGVYTKATDANALNWGLPSGNHSLGKLAPVFDITPPTLVVSEVSSSAPAAGSTPQAVNNSAKSSISYHYEGAKIQAAGRGFLGFEQIKTVDEQTGVNTTTTYRQDWPFIGHPLKTEVRTAQNHLLSKAENIWKLQGYNSSWGNTAKNNGTNALGFLQPYIHQSIEKTYALESNGTQAGSLLQTVTTDNIYDNYGNPTSITVTTNGGGKNFQKVTTNNYVATEFNDAIYSQEKGRLSHTTVVSKRDEDGDTSYELTSTRTSSFTYYSDNNDNRKGLLKTETIEPNNSALTLTTTHDYDDWGNRVKSVVTNADNTETRCDVVTAEYEGTGRYVHKNYDCLGRTISEVVTRNEYGEPLEIKTYLDTTASNSISTHYAYTSRGIRYMESSDTGAWQATTLHNCSSGGGGCPVGAVYYSESTAAGGSKSREYFDLLGRSVMNATVGFDGQWVYAHTEYDNLGRVKHKSEPYYYGAGASNWTTMTYDILGRATHILLPDNSQGTTAYNGYSTVTTNDLTQSKEEIKNALGEVTQVTDNLGGSGVETSTATYKYDAQGNMTQMIDHAGNTTYLCYDLLGRKIAMNDPDKGGFVSSASTVCPTDTAQATTGWWLYNYNVFGELEIQIDAKGQQSVMVYDDLGRMETRSDYTGVPSTTTIEGATTWTYDTAVNGLGQLGSVGYTDSWYNDNSVRTGYTKGVKYDTFGRVSTTETNIIIEGADDLHYEKVTYDQYSRTYQVFDAARDSEIFTDNGVETRYNQYGYQHQLVDAVYVNNEPRSIYQEILAMNARGQVTSEKLGNNATTARTYDDETGRIERILATTMLGSSGDIQDLEYEWDTAGNLDYRWDRSGNKNLEEEFGYDGLNRLETYHVTGQTPKTTTYDSLGNIKTKTGVGGTYVYGTAGVAGPHAVTSAGGATYLYDNNGNNTSGDGRTIAYTTYDKAKSVSKGAHTTTFAYGPDRARYKRIDTNASGTKTTLYIGSVEKITNVNNTKQVKRTIGGVAIITLNQDSGGNTQSTDTNYLYKDHLGSLDIITDATGAIATNGGEMSFDAFGQRRDAINWQDISSSVVAAGFGVFSNSGLGPVTTRGFTGHEMADEVGIIHMNGRIYDPKLGRFLQADPFVQSPTDTQMLNRYSYVRNNPLNAVDPSGYFLDKLFEGLNKLLGDFAPVVAIAVGVLLPGSSLIWGSLANSLTAYATAGFVAGGIATGSLKGAAFGALSAAAFYGVGQAFGDTGSFFKDGGLGHIGAHAVTGGIMSELQGGKFGHGFVSAGVVKSLSGPISDIDVLEVNGVSVGEVAAAAVVGGTVSELTGGKFKNGAMTGAFQNLFNQQSVKSAAQTRLKLKYGEILNAELKNNGDLKAALAVTDDITLKYNSKTGYFSGEVGVGKRKISVNISARKFEGITASYDRASLRISDFSDLGFSARLSLDPIYLGPFEIMSRQSFSDNFSFKNTRAYRNANLYQQGSTRQIKTMEEAGEL